MSLSKLPLKALAALAGATLLASAFAAPAAAMPLPAPGIGHEIGAPVQQVWWRRWHHHRHCWRGPRGHLHCGW